MKKVLALCAVVMLSACSTVSGGLGAAEQTLKSGADIQAQATMKANCGIIYGAYTRLPLNQQLAVELACGGNWLQTLQRMGVMNGAQVEKED